MCHHRSSLLHEGGAGAAAATERCAYESTTSGLPPGATQLTTGSNRGTSSQQHLWRRGAGLLLLCTALVAALVAVMRSSDQGLLHYRPLGRAYIKGGPLGMYPAQFGAKLDPDRLESAYFPQFQPNRRLSCIQLEAWCMSLHPHTTRDGDIMLPRRDGVRQAVGRCKLDPGLKAPGFKSST